MRAWGVGCWCWGLEALGCPGGSVVAFAVAGRWVAECQVSRCLSLHRGGLRAAGWTALHVACSQQRQAALDLLLEEVQAKVRLAAG